jgi:hypothetical protein
VCTTRICNLSPGENGQSVHDILFAYLSQTPEGIKLRQQGEKQQALEHARERLERAVKGLKDKIASENEVVRQIYKQITPTFDPGDDGIWSEIDLLEGDPMHRGVAMRNPRHKPFWLRAEGDEWQGLWEKDTFKKWNRSDLLPNDRVFTSRYVYKIKRSAKTGEAYRFKARMIVRGFEMEKGVDYVDNFSPTPGLAVARLMMSLAIANDMELHKIDIEQAFLQADKLDEGVNGRYFNMWECNPVATPLDPNVRLTKLDCPEVVDPLVHRKYRSIVGCLSFSQLSKFLQCPGDAHLAAAYRVLAYVKGTLNQGLSYHDPGVGKRNTLSGWVDSDLASDIDTRKSVTGYLMVLNGGPVSWKASRQGGVTLSSSEAEFVAACQVGKEVVYLRALLKGFATWFEMDP